MHTKHHSSLIDLCNIIIASKDVANIRIFEYLMTFDSKNETEITLLLTNIKIYQKN